MADKMVTVKVLRFDPSVDAEPTYKTYEAPWKEYTTALEVLHYINENIEPIGFDYCCRSSLCGRCSIMVDGKPFLACEKALDTGEYTLEPLVGFPVIKDLVVDHAHIMEKMTATGLAVESMQPIQKLGNIPYDLYWNTLEPLNMCRECMMCYTVCPPLQEDNKWESFIGPAAMAQIGMRFLDPNDQADRVTQAALSGVFDCTLCGKCSAVCPAQIPHKAIFEMLQTEAEKIGLKP
ncbi:MAG TPA: 2Fe-2S iron-sulfur cluster-binding protein [Anaerolineaceae bacterium]|mgnify:CR=1 FL=1|nr:2Fe-2S iron-sulfur cluster-binding protein [Anaerolineaceae bacterium]